jgi:hypothetical protein
LLSLALMTPLQKLLLPSRGWLGFAAAAAVTVLPQVLLMQAGGGEAHAGSGMLRSIRWQPGWLSANAQWPLFWLRNLGPLLPLAVWALWQWKSEAVTRRLLGAMLMLFVFGNLVVFQPWDWDNTKILLYAYVAICILASALLVSAWRSGSILARAGCVLALLVSLLSGVRLQLHVLAGKDRFTFLTREELGLAEWARAQTPAHTRFLVGLQHNHPIPVLSGRPVIMSYEGWLWSQGHDPEPYERDVRAMYALGPGADSLLDHYGVGRVVIGPDEVRRFDPDTLAWRARFRSVYRSARYEVFATGKDEAR